MKLIADNIILRAFTKDDIPRIAILANNKKISSNLRDSFPHPYSIQDAKNFINSCSNEDPTTTFAIEWKGNYVGNIGLFIGKDVYRKSAEIGYFIGEPYWNKGIASKAVEIITDYGFKNLHLVRIFSGIFEFNLASMRVMEKNRYKKDAVFKKAVFKNGKIWDEHRYYKLNKE